MCVRLLAAASLALITASGAASAATITNASGLANLSFMVPDGVTLLLDRGMGPSVSTSTMTGVGDATAAANDFGSNDTNFLVFNYNLFASSSEPGGVYAAQADYEIFFDIDALGEYEIPFTLTYAFSASVDAPLFTDSGAADAIFSMFLLDGDVIGAGGLPFQVIDSLFGSKPFFEEDMIFQTVRGALKGTGPDFGFISLQTSAFAQTTAIPLPAAAWLLLASLGALAYGGLAARRRAA